MVEKKLEITPYEAVLRTVGYWYMKREEDYSRIKNERTWQSLDEFHTSLKRLWRNIKYMELDENQASLEGEEKSVEKWLEEIQILIQEQSSEFRYVWDLLDKLDDKINKIRSENGIGIRRQKIPDPDSAMADAI